MAQHLRILESLWAKEGAGSSGVAAADQLAIRDAGFDGAGVRFIGPDSAGEVASFLRDHGNLAGACYPTDVDDLKPGSGAGGAAWRRPPQLAAQRAAAAD